MNTTKTTDYDEMLGAAFQYWFSDNGPVRSPFPEYIREKLRAKTLDLFFDCINTLSEEDKKDLGDKILAEKLDEFLFETALKLVQTEDEKITIRYPMMIRIGDVVEKKNSNGTAEKSKVYDRWIFQKEKNKFLKVKLQKEDSAEKWETEFELPE